MQIKLFSSIHSTELSPSEWTSFDELSRDKQIEYLGKFQLDRNFMKIVLHPEDLTKLYMMESSMSRQGKIDLLDFFNSAGSRFSSIDVEEETHGQDRVIKFNAVPSSHEIKHLTVTVGVTKPEEFVKALKPLIKPE